MQLDTTASRQVVVDALTSQTGLASWWTNTVEVAPGVGGMVKPSFAAAPLPGLSLEKIPLGVRWCQGGGARVGGSGVGVPAEPPEEIGSRRVERVVIIEAQLVYQRQSRARAVHLADGDRAVEGHDRRRIDRQELVIQRHDLRPIGFRDSRGL